MPNLAFNNQFGLPETGEIVGTGWLSQAPDLRDYTEAHPDVAPMVKKMGVTPRAPLPDKVDLRKWCSPNKKSTQSRIMQRSSCCGRC